MRHRRTPRTTSAVPSSFRPWPAIALLVVSSCVDVARGLSACTLAVVDEVDEADGEPEELPWRSWRTRWEHSLRAMSVGSMEERLEAIEDADEIFDSVWDEDDEDPANLTEEEIADRLIDFIDTEPDEWMSWNLLDSLEFDEGEGVRRLFRAALQSPSATLRAKALEFYWLEEDSEAIQRLEALWDDGVPAWGLPALMWALANQESKTHLADFVARTDDSDPRVRVAAIKALADIQDDATLPRLLELARSEERLVRGAAIEALGDWTASEQTIAALVEAIHADPVWRVRALDALTRLEGSARDEQLLELLADPESTDLHADVARALEKSLLPSTGPALVRALENAASLGPGETVTTLLAVLHNRDDAGVVPDLVNLDPGIGGTAFLNLRRLIAFLERDRATARTYRISPSRSARPSDEPVRSRHVLSEGPARTVRCWQGPGVAMASRLEPRIPAGTAVDISGFFDRDGETWGALEGDGANDCWLPLRLLAEGAGSGPRPQDPRRREIDVPSDAIHTSTARKLIEAGSIEILDDHEDVAGIAVHLGADRPTLSEVFARLKSATRRRVEEQMEDLIEDLEEESRAASARP